MSAPLLDVQGLGLDVPDLSAPRARGATPLRSILTDVNFTLGAGQSMGVIGESGSGKSSLARALTLLMPPQRGRIVFNGQAISPLMPPEALRDYRAQFQMIFQDPMSALNPRRRVGASIVRPLQALGLLQGRKPDQAAAALLDRVGLPTSFASRFPHELSGGQRQRVNIARALALTPKAIIADEVTSGLDVSAQARIVELLESLRRDEGLALIFISHDLSLVRSLCDNVLILREGQVVEKGRSDEVFAAPKSDYTRKLLDSIPLPEPDSHWLETA
jgi:peptide/nickel transport system ATP-binding protein